jgi:two-component system OmpR family response regulator
VNLLNFRFSTIWVYAQIMPDLHFTENTKTHASFWQHSCSKPIVEVYSAIVNPACANGMLENTNKKLRALIIDDEEDICYLLKGILRQKDIDVSYVTTLADAEIHLQQNDPPVIFLDNHLSDGMGVDHIAGIKRAHPSACIIMITAHDTSKDREIAYKKGVDFFIGKPFTRETIMKTIEKIKSA